MIRWMGILLFVLLALPLTAQEMPPAPVVVSRAVERDVASRRTFVGTVEAARVSLVGNQLDGVVVEHLCREGQRVSAGQPLAKLRTRLIQIRIEAAVAERKLRIEELAELRNGSRKEDVDQARARVTQAESTLELQRWKLDRGKELFDKSVISEGELKDLALAMRVGGTSLDSARAALTLIEAGPRKERILQAQARLAVRGAIVAQLEDELERHTIRAPFDGYVVAEHTEVGQWLRQGDPVAEIAALDEVDVVVPVLEDDALKISLGLEVPIRVAALPDLKLRGRISAVVPKADRRARTFPVKIRLKNPRQDGGVLLKDGMSVTVYAPVGKTRRVLLVNKDALVLGGATPVVYVVTGDAVVPVPVRVGIAVDGHVQVDGALKAGALVVVRGNERLRPGQKVRITETVD